MTSEFVESFTDGRGRERQRVVLSDEDSVDDAQEFGRWIASRTPVTCEDNR